MQVFVQLLITGVAMGFIYALVGIEYTLIWNSTGLLNFSHDKFILFGAYMFAGSYVLSLGLPPVLAILCTVLTMFLLGMVSAFAIFNPLSRLSTNLFAVIGTVILGRIITECVRLIWGPLPFTLDNFLRGSFHLGPIVVSKAHIVIIVVCSIITAGLQIFFKTTKMGKAMRCVSENKTAASLMLTVLHIFLNIQCNCFRHTEILHSFRNCNTQFSTQIKEMVDSMTRSEYNGSVVENRNFLLPKFFRRKTFNLDKRPEIYFYAILLCNVVIGRFL